MDALTNLLARALAENATWNWLAAAIVATVVLTVGWTVRGFVRRRHRQYLATDTLELFELPFEVASRTATTFLVAVALVAGFSFVELPPRAGALASKLFTVIAFWQLGLWASTALVAWLVFKRRTATEEDRETVGSFGVIGFLGRVLVWTFVLLLTLDNLGIDITALVAGLGVGGVAVALAVQNILGDLFASLSITLDRPFVIGDFVIVGDYMGSVEYIGIKSTRLRSLGGEQIVVSNADLLASRVRNYGRMAERRVLFRIGVTYETPRRKLEAIPGLIRRAIESQASVRFDRSHFASYGDFSLDFETVYYVLSPDYGRYMDIQQAINFAIHEAFEREGIEFAYPTRKLWVAPVPGEPIGNP